VKKLGIELDTRDRTSKIDAGEDSLNEIAETTVLGVHKTTLSGTFCRRPSWRRRCTLYGGDLAVLR